MFRYIAAIVIVLACAVAVVHWQTNPHETISFTPPSAEETTSDIETQQELNPSNIDNSKLGSSSNEEAENLPYQPLEATPSAILDRRIPSPQIELSDEQLATQISIAKQQLEQVEAVNQRKQSQFAKILEQESTAEQSLLEAELAYRIGGWRDAWQAGEVDRYLSFYSSTFQPSNRETFDQWKARRVRLVSATRSIQLQMENFLVVYDPETKRSLVTFIQFYESANYKDVSKKRIVFENQQGQWMIVSEITE